MFLTNTVTKKALENIVHETFSNFGSITSSSLLDSLKFLGFYYATNAGISINIEDLKTPNMKKKFLETANEETKYVSEQWQQGFVSDTERFQSIIDSWNVATESLKNRIVDYYQNFDPANNLYIMAFSGARGNMSQVRQLVGMRGLMSDQEGRIIDLPIKANFREGLSSIDYIISSYGARKGIVDTALKTADSGYLTRRLIYVAQDLIIREIDCKTKSGVIVFLKPNTNFKNITGRVLISSYNLNNSKEIAKKFNNSILNPKVLSSLKELSPLILKLRSPLTCNSNGSICQKCYGWDLAQKQMISLGETVGIIAAQSIGEPGTQLTMRTFHTGGIFTSEVLQQLSAPFSGKLQVPDSLKTISYRTSHGIVVSKLQQETKIILLNWNGKKEEIFLKIGSFLYINKSQFVKKGELISEYSDRAFIAGARRLKPIYTTFSGEIKFESLLVRNIFRDDKPKVKVNQDDGILWLASGKILPLPKEAKYLNLTNFSKNKACASLSLVSPYGGIVKVEGENLFIITNEKKFKINLSSLTQLVKSYQIRLSILVKNYQYIDQYTELVKINIFPKFRGHTYLIRQKKSKYLNILFFITENDVWKINSDQLNNFSYFPNKRTIIRAGNSLNQTTNFNNSGFFIRRDGFKMIFQKALPIFLSRGTILNYKQGDFVFENEILATLVNYTQQTEDIVQGLPKIEELVEARVPKNKTQLAIRPGIFLNHSELDYLDSINVKNETITYVYSQENQNTIKKTSTLKNRKQSVKIVHSLFLKENILFYKEKIWKGTLVPPEFKVQRKANGDYFFTNNLGKLLLINGKQISSKWNGLNYNENEQILYEILNQKRYFWRQCNSNEQYYQNKNGDLIIQTISGQFIYLEVLNPVVEYKLPLSTKLFAKAGNFVDIGEPICEGAIDPHELLNIFSRYHAVFDGTMIGTIRSLNKFQLLVVNSVQAIYQSQGVNISSKHIEIIVRQMTSKVVIKKSGDTPFLPGEVIRLSLITEVYKILKDSSNTNSFKTPKYEPLLLSTTNSSLSKDGFLSAAGFQETKRVLAKAAIEGTSDWLRGLKECVIIGRLVPAGSAFLNYKNYLDNIYLFKN